MKEDKGEIALSEGTGDISGTLVSLRPKKERGAGFSDEGSWYKFLQPKCLPK